ncbi:hypothetical protein [Terrisporobacter sp.]|uniref:hypothetical protein n=1 Tax=Terrisporobacter sp. TaxID=1965305 RepID=UPI002896A79C|nr:hypothetical protein [Terrisporobacter sp.]
MSNKSKQIYRIEKYLEEIEIKNIIFISHTKESAKLYYDELKGIIDLDKYNILFISERTNKKEDGLLPSKTMGIMCGVWYKNKELREDYYLWKLIDNIYTLPLSEIDHIDKNDDLTFNINIDPKLLMEEMSKHLTEEINKYKERYCLPTNTKD